MLSPEFLQVDPGEVGGGGEEVPEGGGEVGGGVWGDVTGPAGDEGDADAAFVEVALGAAEGAGGVEEGGVDAALVVGAVVAGEDD